MKMIYISKIQTGLRGYSRINTNKLTSCLLDGSYNSVYKGRSLNFDELREYVPGDNISDMDWKASSRSGKMLVRQYVAEKKHNIMLVMDTNRRMLADTKDLIEKRETAIMAAGTLAYLINRQADFVGATMFCENGVRNYPLKTELLNIELILQDYHKSVVRSNKSSVNDSLEYIARNFKHRMILIIVTDAEGVCGISENLIKRLMILHDVLLINISDADLSGKNLYDVENGEYLPEFFTRSKSLGNHLKERSAQINRECFERLARFGIASITIDNTDELDVKISELLRRKDGDNR